MNNNLIKSSMFLIAPVKKPLKKWFTGMTMSSMLLTLPAHAADLIYANDDYDYRLPDTVAKVCRNIEGYNCPEINIQYASSSQQWVNMLINSRINQLLPYANADDHPSPNLSVPSTSMVKELLDNFAKSQLEAIPRDSSLYYQFNIQPNYLGHIKDIEQFEIDSYIYTGGAHGVGYTEYMILDNLSNRQLRLDDMLVVNKKSKLKSLVYSEYQDWMQENGNDLKTHEDRWPFVLTDNVMLTDEGLKFTYQPYEIAAYVYGMPELTVPYTKLKGILKDKYLH